MIDGCSAVVSSYVVVGRRPEETARRQAFLAGVRAVHAGGGAERAGGVAGDAQGDCAKSRALRAAAQGERPGTAGVRVDPDRDRVAAGGMGVITQCHGSPARGLRVRADCGGDETCDSALSAGGRSEEHTSEPPSLMRIPYAVFRLKKKKQKCTRTQASRTTSS